MDIINIKRIVGLGVLFTVAVLTFAFNPAVRADNNIEPPKLPPLCGDLQVPSGNKAFFRVFALGVQIYRWNGATWDFVSPVANLYADDSYRAEVGFHYAGPTWESNSGSQVVAARLTGCSPNPTTAIPWLLLQAVSTDGPGIFRRVTYIQRVNTVGGLGPTNPGSSVGAEARIPYTAEYYFYRARRND